MLRVKNADGGTYTFPDEDVIEDSPTHAIVKVGGKTFRIEKESDSMKHDWSAYEDENLTPTDVARLLAELQAHRAEKRNRETTKRVQPTRAPVADDDALALVIRAAAGGHHGIVNVGVPTVEDTDGSLRKAQAERDPAAARIIRTLDGDE
jgi:hypothetical protein